MCQNYSGLEKLVVCWHQLKLEPPEELVRRVNIRVREQATAVFQSQKDTHPTEHPLQRPKKVYWLAAQATIPPDKTAKLDEDNIKLVQQVIWVFLYYNSAVEDTILPALSAIASE